MMCCFVTILIISLSFAWSYTLQRKDILLTLQNGLLFDWYLHLWVAIIAYLLLARIKAEMKTSYSITEVATLIRVSALERTDLRDLLTETLYSNSSNQNVKDQLNLFDNL